MTKKTLTVYSMLFLFAFTFAFAFTLASSARADVWDCGCTCCEVYCEGYPAYTSVVGHWEKIDPFGDCTMENMFCSGQSNRCSPSPCKDHFTYLCPD